MEEKILLIHKFETNGRVYSVKLTSDGYKCVAGTGYRTDKRLTSGELESGKYEIILFDLKDLIELWRYEVESNVWRVDIQPKGEKIVACTERGFIYLIDENGNKIWDYHVPGTVWSVAISPDGELIVAGCNDGCAYFLSSMGQLLKKEIIGSANTSGIRTVAISKDGCIIGTGNYYNKNNNQGGDLYLFNKDLEVINQYHIGRTIGDISFSDNGRYVIAGAGGAVFFFDKSSPEKALWQYQTSGIVESVSINADAKYIVVGSRNSRTYLFNHEGKMLWEKETGTWREGHFKGEWIRGIQITPDGKYITAVSGDAHVYLFDYEGRMQTHPCFNMALSVSMTFDGRFILTGSKDKSVYLLKRLFEINFEYELNKFRQFVELGLVDVFWKSRQKSLFADNAEGIGKALLMSYLLAKIDEDAHIRQEVQVGIGIVDIEIVARGRPYLIELKVIHNSNEAKLDRSTKQMKEYIKHGEYFESYLIAFDGRRYDEKTEIPKYVNTDKGKICTIHIDINPVIPSK